MQVSIAFGMIGTVLAMSRAFQVLGASGIGDPSQLGAVIGEALIASFVGMLVALIGAIFMLVAVFGYRYRESWMFRLLIILGVLYLLYFPLGTVIGVVFLSVALIKRHEFGLQSSVTKSE